MAERCRSCKEPIRWAVTERGRRIPLDAEPTPRGTMRLEPPSPDGTVPLAITVPAEQRGAHGGRLFLSHFASCTFADRHRQRR